MLCFGVHQPESLLVKGSQSVEQLIRNEKVGGSIPLSGTTSSSNKLPKPTRVSSFSGRALDQQKQTDGLGLVTLFRSISKCGPTPLSREPHVLSTHGATYHSKFRNMTAQLLMFDSLIMQCNFWPQLNRRI